MQKKLGWTLILILLGSLVWYLFIKPNDYQVTFRTKAIPGTVNQSIKLWAAGLDQTKLISQTNLFDFKHQIQFRDSIYEYDWQIKALNDSVSEVKVLVKDVKHSLSNKVAIAFSETDFEKRTKSTVKNLMFTLKEHIDSFKVTISGTENIPAKYCAYVSLKSPQTQKALKMMENYPFLNSVLSKNKVQLDGLPFIEIEDWDMEKDSITYNFCYPIIKKDTLPEIAGLAYKQVPAKKAIKSIYNGNYITSDRAWYALIDYAKKNQLAILKTPVEVYHNNPNMGDDELNWKAEVYMPLKE